MKSLLWRFLGVLAVVITYLVVVSIHYGFSHGILITALSWSFFVFCTPIADAGFLLDFPIRLLLKVRMVLTESFVWAIAAMINIYALLVKPEIYSTTLILQLFKHILLHPFPYALIILLSAAGTFMSVWFGDQLIEKNKRDLLIQKKKYRIIAFVVVILLIILVYDFLLKGLGVHI